MNRMRPICGLAFCLMSSATFGYEANGIGLGASEETVLKRFPTAYCKPLEWTSRAADRRCDEPKALIGGVESRITFYLKQDRVQAFDVRFESRDAARLAAFLEKRYGAASGERGARTRLQWDKDGERAVLTSQADKRRAFFTVSRGDFEDQIYR